MTKIEKQIVIDALNKYATDMAIMASKYHREKENDKSQICVAKANQASALARCFEDILDAPAGSCAI